MFVAINKFLESIMHSGATFKAGYFCKDGAAVLLTEEIDSVLSHDDLYKKAVAQAVKLEMDFDLDDIKIGKWVD